MSNHYFFRFIDLREQNRPADRSGGNARTLVKHPLQSETAAGASEPPCAACDGVRFRDRHHVGSARRGRLTGYFREETGPVCCDQGSGPRPT